MKKSLRIIACGLLSSLLLFQAAACKQGGDSGDNSNTESRGSESVSESPSVEKEHEIWGTYSTAKVGQDPDSKSTYAVTAPEINVSMMKSETEGGQIIITAGKDINSFSLRSGELKTADGKAFPLSNVDIYQQKYIKVNKKTDFNGVYSIGEYVPDMLLPMSISESYGENTVKKGDNQGIYVEFDSTGVEDGLYTGNFVLDIDGEKTSIPVSVNVWNIEYTGRRTFKSCFVMYQSSLLRGEFDTSDEVVNNYIDFFLDYKINTCLHNKRRNNFAAYGESWLESVVRTKDNLNYNSVYIPYQFPPSFNAYRGGVPTSETEECLKYVTALAKICTPDDMYIDYAYFYPFELDEADIDEVNNRAANAERMLSDGGDVDQMLALAVDRLKEDDEFNELRKQYGDEFADHVLDSVLKIPTLFTNVNFMSEWVDNYTADFCPYLSVFGSGRVTEHYAAEAEKKNSEVWAYTCVGPTYPYPTFHIDDYNLGTRVSGWMEKCYGIDGYLYWASTNGHNNLEWYKYINQYEDASRYDGADGDGYLVYPGKYYGSSTPLPSLRLVAYRDSMDDYDMLCVYENLLEKYYEKYNLGKLDFSDYVEDLYSDLFNSAIYNTDDSILAEVRNKLAERIIALQNGDDIMFTETYENGKTVTKVYASVSSLNLDGKSVNGTKIGDNAYVFVSETSGGVLKVKSANSEVEFALRDSANIPAAADKVSASDGSVASGDGTTISATLKGKLFGSGLNDIKTMSFTPSVSIKTGGIKNANNVVMTIENLSDEAVDLYVKLISDGTVYELGSTYIEAGKSRRVRMNLDGDDLLFADGTLHIYMQNVAKNKNGDFDLQNDRILKITSLRAEYARGNA